MRSASLLAVLGLVLVLAASSFSPVAAAGYIRIHKVGGDTETIFVFDASPAPLVDFQLLGGFYQSFAGPFSSGTDYTITERVPEGWVLSVRCELGPEITITVTDFEYIHGGVIIRFSQCTNDCVAWVDCYFTNSRPPVGGIVIPVDTFAVLGPWVAVMALVGCIGTVVVVAKKRR